MHHNFLVFTHDSSVTRSCRIDDRFLYRKIPRDLTEASLSGAGLSILAALLMVFLFGMVTFHFLVVFFSIVMKTFNSHFGAGAERLLDDNHHKYCCC